jgi:hypothetical protein
VAGGKAVVSPVRRLGRWDAVGRVLGGCSARPSRSRGRWPRSCLPRGRRPESWTAGRGQGPSGSGCHTRQRRTDGIAEARRKWRTGGPKRIPKLRQRNEAPGCIVKGIRGLRASGRRNVVSIEDRRGPGTWVFDDGVARPGCARELGRVVVPEPYTTGLRQHTAAPALGDGPIEAVSCAGYGLAPLPTSAPFGAAPLNAGCMWPGHRRVPACRTGPGTVREKLSEPGSRLAEPRPDLCPTPAEQPFGRREHFVGKTMHRTIHPWKCVVR